MHVDTNLHSCTQSAEYCRGYQNDGYNDEAGFLDEYYHLGVEAQHGNLLYLNPQKIQERDFQKVPSNIRRNNQQKLENMTRDQHMIHFKSERGGKTATEQADEFVSQDSVRGISISIYEYGILLLYEEL